MASWAPSGNNGIVIEQPCTSCGIPLTRGVKYVAIANLIVGLANISLWATLIALHGEFSTFAGQLSPENIEGEEKEEEEGAETADGHFPTEQKFEAEDFRIYHAIFIAFLTFAVLQVLLSFLLFVASHRRSVPLLYTWLIISGFTIPGYGLYILVKLYEIIVVFAYVEELNCEAHAEALERFRNLPFLCNIKTQMYPTSVCGEKIPTRKSIQSQRSNTSIIKSSRTSMDRRNTTTSYFQDKTFFINNMSTSLFHNVRHYQLF